MINGSLTSFPYIYIYLLCEFLCFKIEQSGQMLSWEGVTLAVCLEGRIIFCFSSGGFGVSLSNLRLSGKRDREGKKCIESR